MIHSHRKYQLLFGGKHQKKKTNKTIKNTRAAIKVIFYKPYYCRIYCIKNSINLNTQTYNLSLKKSLHR